MSPAELAGSGFSEETLLKWSLHPVVGPRLRSGRLMDERSLPPELRAMVDAAQREAAAAGGAAGLGGMDFFDGLEEKLKEASGGDPSCLPWRDMDLSAP